MTEDIQKSDVQSTTTSTTEPVVPPEPAKPTVPAQPSPEEALKKLIAEEVAKVVTQQSEKAKREIQSMKDKATAEVERAKRRARDAENILGTTRQALRSIDPDSAKELELAELRAREQTYKAQEDEEAVRQTQKAFYDDFQTSLNQFVTDLGIDPTDKRIDWGDESLTPLDIMRKVQTSVAKIQKESIQTMKSGLEKRLSEIEAKVNAEANSVDTTSSVGVSSKGIPTDIGKFRGWVANLPQTEYEKLKPEIDKLLAEGKIK